MQHQDSFSCKQQTTQVPKQLCRCNLFHTEPHFMPQEGQYGGLPMTGIKFLSCKQGQPGAWRQACPCTATHRNIELLLLAPHKVLHDLDGLADVAPHRLHLLQAVLIVLAPPPRLWPVHLLSCPAQQQRLTSALLLRIPFDFNDLKTLCVCLIVKTSLSPLFSCCRRVCGRWTFSHVPRSRSESSNALLHPITEWIMGAID